MTHLPEELTQRLLAFRAERDWEQFHNARSLATALSVEASELLEHFIWPKGADVAEIVDKRSDEIEAELPDVGMLLAYLCHDLGVDLAAAVSRKLGANALKYPVESRAGDRRSTHASEGGCRGALMKKVERDPQDNVATHVAHVAGRGRIEEVRVLKASRPLRSAVAAMPTARSEPCN